MSYPKLSAFHSLFWHRLWQFWYWLTAPVEPPITATLTIREQYRRARLTAMIIFILLILTIPSLFVSIWGAHSGFLLIPCFLCLATVLAAYLNRSALVTSAGLLLVISYTAAMMFHILTTPGGLSLSLVPVFTILIIPDMLAAVLLPAYCVFASALINTLFCWLAITYMPHTAGLEHLTGLMYVNSVLLTGTLQGMIAGISFLWSASLQRALRERDKAEETVRLERDLADQSMSMTQQKEQLEYSIELIVQAQSRVANGDLNTRIPLTADNVLWSVAGPLNNMIARLQRARAIEEEIEKIQKGIAYLTAMIRLRKQGQPTPPYSSNGTLVDTLAIEIFPPQGYTTAKLPGIKSQPLQHPGSSSTGRQTGRLSQDGQTGPQPVPGVGISTGPQVVPFHYSGPVTGSQPVPYSRLSVNTASNPAMPVTKPGGR